MCNKEKSAFFPGLFIGLMVGLGVWYWQKSTMADDGAIALLDRLKLADDKVRQLRAELTGQMPQGIVLPENDEVPPFLDHA